MIRPLKRLSRNERGAPMIEFAIIGPVLLMLIIAMLQLGMLFFAHTGLKSAVSDGARLATIYPRPNDTRIAAHVQAKRFGLDPAALSAPTFTHTQVEGRDYIDIRMSYAANVRFLFIPVTTITLVEQRRTYVHPV